MASCGLWIRIGPQSFSPPPREKPFADRISPHPSRKNHLKKLQVLSVKAFLPCLPFYGRQNEFAYKPARIHPGTGDALPVYEMLQTYKFSQKAPLRFKRTAYTFIFLNLIPLEATAFLIGNMPKEKLIPQSCRMEFYTLEGQLNGTCSGTIVSENQILSSAHCVSVSPEMVQAVCPDGKRRRIKRSRMPRAFRSAFEVTPLSHDFALFEIQGKFETPPVKMAQTREDIEKLAKESKECSIYGYGLDAKGIAGEHNGATVTLIDFQESVVFMEYRINPLTLGFMIPVSMIPAFGVRSIRNRIKWDQLRVQGKVIQPGDSGGGIFCRDKEHHMVLIGINQSIPKDPKIHEGYGLALVKATSWLQRNLNGCLLYTSPSPRD